MANDIRLVASEKFEYKTTIGKLHWEYTWDGLGYSVKTIDNPTPPDGEGWELVNTVLSTDKNHDSNDNIQLILWFWKRCSHRS